MASALTPVPPLQAHQLLLLLLQLGVLLLLALCLGRLAQRFGMPAVVGELLTGVLLGPSVLGNTAPGLSEWLLPAHRDQVHLLDAVGQIGAVLLVGVVGAHLDTAMMLRRSGTVAGVTAGGLVVPLMFGITAGYLTPRELLPTGPDRITFALFLGVAISVSAVPVIAKTLSDMRLLHRDVGQLTLASATIDDAMAWFLLSLISAMVVNTFDAGRMLVAALGLLGFVAVAAVLGRPAVRLAMRWANSAADPGPANATAAIIVLLSAAAAQSLGIEAVFGALVAGILIGSPGVADPARLSPLRTVALSVLAPIFLASAGLRVDLSALGEPVVLAAAGVILVLAVLSKFAGVYVGARLSRQGHWEALALGAGLNARGVVQIIIAMVGLRLGVLNTAMYTIIVLVAVLTSVMAPPMLRWAMARVEHNAQERLREIRLTAWSHPPRAADGAPK